MKKDCIKRLVVKDLWFSKDIDVSFFEDVNIIIGKNGTGKTTLLKILIDVLRAKQIKDIDLREVTVDFMDNNHIGYSKKHLLNDKIINNEIDSDSFMSMLDNLKKDIMNEIKSAEKGNIKIKVDEKEKAVKNLPIHYFSTFDMELKNKKTAMNIEDKEYIKTELDVILYNLINDFKLYQLKLKTVLEETSNNIDKRIKIISSSRNSSDKDLNLLKKLVYDKETKTKEIYSTKEKFKEILSNLFKDTNKKVDFDENNSLVFDIGDKKITPYNLSSGEKQVLAILLNVVLTENKFCLLIMDEPEISLHVEWQNKFIDNLKSLNENMQIFIATHSPAIVTKGWKGNIIKMDDITKSNK